MQLEISVQIESRIESAATIPIRIKSVDSHLQLQSSMLNFCWLPYKSFVTL